MQKRFAVYILASQRNGTLYTGFTGDLLQRIWQHKNGVFDGFSKQYQTHYLVWYELYENAQSAINREKQIKKWRRQWKLNLIEQYNPQWRDLWLDICDKL